MLPLRYASRVALYVEALESVFWIRDILTIVVLVSSKTVLFYFYT
jgi:hypothetical protein